ncbi:cell division protein FtsX [Owenweeksia hongkongensis]|uniref:cell division protein FtsX n=1 Tax=Owenweeksia hongkongensis TaxID=253245 RepID=UPI0005A1091C|nr:permease-like cell division protein FtsX [Owenweeksia hongkongensis]
MSNLPDKFTRRRLRSSYISVVVSISLVLFVLGLFGLLVINARVIANEVKENFAITVLINNDAPEVEVRQFQKSLELTPYVKTTEFISKEEAAAELKEELDEDFMDFLGYNPLLNSIEVRLKADYVNEEQLTFLEKEYSKKSFVNEVVYDKPLIQMMNENIERIGLFLIAGSILLSLIAIALINSSIRLSIYSRRFLIKTMQLVGATKTFIRKPFIWRSLRHGLLGSLVALGFLTLLIYYVSLNVPGFTELQNPVKLALLYAGVLLTGILISMSCTFFALRKYLKLTTDQLYY